MGIRTLFSILNRRGLNAKSHLNIGWDRCVLCQNTSSCRGVRSVQNTGTMQSTARARCDAPTAEEEDTGRRNAEMTLTVVPAKGKDEQRTCDTP